MPALKYTNENQAGKVYGKWKVIKRVNVGVGEDDRWESVCECGTRRNVAGYSLRKGTSRDCGCGRRVVISNLFATHRLGVYTPEYRAWSAMKSRTTWVEHPDYAAYGGRGIKVYEGWISDYPAFLKYVGKRPKGRYSLDRIDVNGNYEPGNVRWADDKTQANNKRKLARIECFSDDELLTEIAKRWPKITEVV